MSCICLFKHCDFKSPKYFIAVVVKVVMDFGTADINAYKTAVKQHKNHKMLVAVKSTTQLSNEFCMIEIVHS